MFAVDTAFSLETHDISVAAWRIEGPRALTDTGEMASETRSVIAFALLVASAARAHCATSAGVAKQLPPRALPRCRRVSSPRCWCANRTPGAQSSIEPPAKRESCRNGWSGCALATMAGAARVVGSSAQDRSGRWRTSSAATGLRVLGADHLASLLMSPHGFRRGIMANPFYSISVTASTISPRGEAVRSPGHHRRRLLGGMRVHRLGAIKALLAGSLW